MSTAQRMNVEEKLFMRWVASYQTTMTFEDFKSKTQTTQKQIDDDRTEEEILKAVKSIIGG
jgi:hypothetical protein